jgi:Gpi18-like mannosyltransferase
MKVLFEKLKAWIKRIQWMDALLVAGGIILALMIRYSLRSYRSGDFEEFNKIWYETVRDNGFGSFGMLTNSLRFNYTPTYLYFLYIVSLLFPKLSSLNAVKLVPVFTDFVSAWFVLKLVRLKFKQGPIPFFAGFIFLLAPTVVLNSAVWGQTDSIYTAFLLATIFFALEKKNWWTSLAFGLAFAIKLQAVFLAPFLVVLFIKKEISWKQLLLIPAVYIILMIPAWIAGRPIGDLLTVYFAQANQNISLELGFPNVYFQLPDELFVNFYRGSLILAASMVFLFVAGIYKSKIKMTQPILIQLALTSVVFMPYFLPKMHDRYLYPGDAISIVFGFFFPEYFYIPILINLISFFIYEMSLFQMHNIPMPVLQVTLTIVLILLVRLMVKTFYPKADQAETIDGTGDQ